MDEYKQLDCKLDNNYAKQEQCSKRLYAQQRCPAICPFDQTQCLLTAGHWGKHKCIQGHEWF